MDSSRPCIPLYHFTVFGLLREIWFSVKALDIILRSHMFIAVVAAGLSALKLKAGRVNCERSDGGPDASYLTPCGGPDGTEFLTTSHG